MRIVEMRGVHDMTCSVCGRLFLPSLVVALDASGAPVCPWCLDAPTSEALDMAHDEIEMERRAGVE